MCSSPINIDMLRNNIRTFHKRTIHYVHWQYLLDMPEPLHFSLSMQQAKASLQKALQKALQDDDDDDEEEDGDNHLVLPDAKKEFIIKEMKDTTSQALHYLTKLRWNATVEGLDNTDQWHSEIANFLLSIFQQRCEETKAMATILRQAGAFADGVDARYPNIAKIVARKQGQCIVTLKDVLLTWSEAVLHSLAKVQDAFARKPRPADKESDPVVRHSDDWFREFAKNDPDSAKVIAAINSENPPYDYSPKNMPNVEFWGDGPNNRRFQSWIKMFRNVHDFFNHDRGLSLSTAAANARRRTQQADTIAKVNAYLHDYTLPPEGVYADTHLLISRRAHDASNDELAVRRIMDLYWKIRNNVSTSSSSTTTTNNTMDDNNRTAISDKYIETSFLQAIQDSGELLPFLPPPTILHENNGGNQGPLCERVFSHYEPFFQSTITRTEENNMHLKTDIPHLKDAGVTLLWDMALQNGHSKQKFYASLALFICCRVNVVWGGAKTLKGNKRKRDKRRSMIPINPSDTRLWKYIRVLANICERTYLAEFRATFPKFHQMTLDESDSEDDDEIDDDDDSSDSGIGIGIEEGVLHTFADLVHDRLKAASTGSNMRSFINALPPSQAKRRFKHICGLAPYFPDFSDRSIRRHFATYAVLPAFTIRWLHRSPIDFRMLTVKDGKQTVPMRHGQ